MPKHIQGRPPQSTGRFRQTPLIFLAAGEASGDLLGGRLMAALKKLTDGQVEFAGVGGPQMEREGLQSLFPMRELSVMGLFEILPHARRLLRRIRETSQAVRDLQPDVVITIDSPGFALRLVKQLQDVNIPKIHYVAPSVWVWKPGRVQTFSRAFDHLLALLPFEPACFEGSGLPCHFVGHSVLESGADKGNGGAFRQSHNIGADVPLFCILPGSRVGEVKRLLPVFRETALRLSAKHPNLRIVLPVTENVRDLVAQDLPNWPGKPILVAELGNKFNAMAASNAALAASGTVALELALARTPTVVAYKMAPMTWFFVRRMVKVRFVHLLNIILDRAVVPERLQKDCQPGILAEDLLALAGEGGRSQTEQLAPALQQLSPPEGLPSECAARVVLQTLGLSFARA